MDDRTLEFFQRIMDNGSIEIDGKSKRWTVMYQGYYFSVSKIVYVLFHPTEDPIGKDEEIHHRDRNKLNDHPDNLMRVTKVWHTEHHRSKTNYAPDWLSPGWVSPILVRQMKLLWMSGTRKVKDIWKAIFKVVDRALIRTVVTYHQRIWSQELNSLGGTCAFSGL